MRERFLCERFFMNNIVQGLWIGARLSRMEYLSVSSFLKNGHDYHLYTYGDVINIPQGTVVKKASEILPESMIFQYHRHKSYSGFSNLFRYKLLLEKGGWWVDSDLICLKQFDFVDEYVFSSEQAVGQQFINCGAVKSPAGSDVIAYAWDSARRSDPSRLEWGEIGPKLLGRAVREFSLECYVKPHDVFCPIGYGEWADILDPAATIDFGANTYAVHLWNEFWRRNSQDKDKSYDPNCLYEKLKRAFCDSEEK